MRKLSSPREEKVKGGKKEKRLTIRAMSGDGESGDRSWADLHRRRRSLEKLSTSDKRDKKSTKDKKKRLSKMVVNPHRDDSNKSDPKLTPPSTDEPHHPDTITEIDLLEPETTKSPKREPLSPGKGGGGVSRSPPRFVPVADRMAAFLSPNLRQRCSSGINRTSQSPKESGSAPSLSPGGMVGGGGNSPHSSPSFPAGAQVGSGSSLPPLWSPKMTTTEEEDGRLSPGSKMLKDFLVDIDLPQYFELFQQEKIDVEVLGDFEAGELRLIGVPLGHGKRIQRGWKTYSVEGKPK